MVVGVRVGGSRAGSVRVALTLVDAEEAVALGRYEGGGAIGVDAPAAATLAGTLRGVDATAAHGLGAGDAYAEVGWAGSAILGSSCEAESGVAVGPLGA